MSRILLAKVLRRERETADTHTYYLEVLNKEPFAYQAGQFLTLFSDIKGEKVNRSYSLASSPSWDNHLAITVKRVLKGKMSNYLNDVLQPGSILEVSPPQGNFCLTYHRAQQRHVIAVAGGSGITPLFSMVKELLLQEPMSKITLIFANRTEEDRIYLYQLQEMMEKYRDRFFVHHILSQPGKSWKGLKGRLDAQKLQKLLPAPVQKVGETLHFLLCGPSGLMQTTEDFLEDYYSKNQYRINKESYQPKKDKKSKKEGPKHYEITFVQGETEQTLRGSEEETILACAEKEGLDIPYGCCSGMCNVCRVKCIEGEVSMLEDEGLSREELEEGYVLACVSYPKSPKITIKIEDDFC